MTRFELRLHFIVCLYAPIFNRRNRCLWLEIWRVWALDVRWSWNKWCQHPMLGQPHSVQWRETSSRIPMWTFHLGSWMCKRRKRQLPSSQRVLLIDEIQQTIISVLFYMYTIHIQIIFSQLIIVPIIHMYKPQREL